MKIPGTPLCRSRPARSPAVSRAEPHPSPSSAAAGRNNGQCLSEEVVFVGLAAIEGLVAGIEDAKEIPRERGT